MSTMRPENAVKDRYAAAAKNAEAQLCSPVNYDPKYLKAIPKEVIERDFGCGDPTRHLREGETVLDLGSGTGKACFIAAQVVGARGRVIGVDMLDEMLSIARRAQPVVAKNIGYANVEFRKGRIQDLALDLEKLDAELGRRPVADANAFCALDGAVQELRARQPLVASDSIDVVISNCVLNLVEPAAKKQLFEEIFRVLKRGGRAVISDIVCDEDVPEKMQQDPELWSGCISGALREDMFCKAFESAGFYGITLLERNERPYRTIQGIEFRSVTVEAHKGKQGKCWERNQAVVYKGPFREVLDDDNHRMERGIRYAVCDKTYQLYKKHPYRDSFAFVEPLEPIALEDAKPFDCSRTALRHPKESKGQDYNVTTEAQGSCCDNDSDCC